MSTVQDRPVLASLSLVLSFAAAFARADVAVTNIFSDHMVLQQGVPVPIWGMAAPGEKVTVKFRDQAKSILADAQGKWMVRLDPLQLGEPIGAPGLLTIIGNNTLTLQDILVGEVWLGAGQSNMAMGTGAAVKSDPVLAALATEGYSKIRFIPSSFASSEKNRGWREATPQNNGTFSALLFAFGVPLQKDLHVPVGLMLGAVGGTPSGRWIAREAFKNDAACQQAVARFAATYSFEDAMKKYQATLEKWEKDVADARQQGKKTPDKPNPPVPAGECHYGEMGSLYALHIQPFVPFAIRGVLWDQGESGSGVDGVSQSVMMGALIRSWRKAWGLDFPFIQVQKPSGGGCAWDSQDPVTDKAEPFALLPEKVASAGWQFAGTEEHLRINQYANVFMAIASDLGSGVHPTNKSGYGARACRVALGAVYGRKIEYYGPVYLAHKIEGHKVRIEFAHVGQGLAYKHGDKLQGFAIAGDDKVFYWAEAVIDGDTVVLACDKVGKPAAVRYAWNFPHAWANLFNKDGLPAMPFRTDAW